jgi:hypothetical protein
MSNIIMDIDLILLKKEINCNSISYITYLYSEYKYKIWDFFAYLKNDYQDLISFLIKHNCINILEYFEDEDDDDDEDADPYYNFFGFSSFYMYHWTLILFESLIVKNNKLIEIASSKLDLNALFHYSKYYNSILDLLLKKENPDLFILFYDYCKLLSNNDHYICFRGSLLNNKSIWNENNKIIPVNKYKNYFSKKWFTPSFIEYINNMIKEEETFNLKFTEVFLEYTYNTKHEELDKEAKYVITDLCLSSLLNHDIIKYVIKNYL